MALFAVWPSDTRQVSLSNMQGTNWRSIIQYTSTWSHKCQAWWNVGVFAHNKVLITVTFTSRIIVHYWQITVEIILYHLHVEYKKYCDNCLAAKIPRRQGTAWDQPTPAATTPTLSASWTGWQWQYYDVCCILPCLLVPTTIHRLICLQNTIYWCRVYKCLVKNCYLYMMWIGILTCCDISGNIRPDNTSITRISGEFSSRSPGLWPENLGQVHQPQCGGCLPAYAHCAQTNCFFRCVLIYSF